MRSVLLSVFIVISCLAWGGIEEGKGRLEGTVFDEYDSTALEYVTIMVLDQLDSSLITGGHTEIDGTFVIPDIPLNKPVFLRIRFMGYKEVVRSGVVQTEKILNLGNIYLKRSVQDIDDVHVTAERAVVEYHVDKKVYNTDQMNPSGNTALDLLREIPSVLVDENDEITFMGQTGITLLVDGRPINMPPARYLQSIGANQVDQIEVVSNPSAKYDAEGTAGIINVKLKKNRKRGISGSTSAMYGYGVNSRYSGSLDLSVHTKKWNVFASYFANDTKRSHNSYTLRETYNGDTLLDRLESDGSDVTGSFSQIIRTGVDFFPNDRNTLYVAGTYNPGKTETPSQVSYYNPTTQSGSDRLTDTWGPINYYDANFGWQSTLGKSVTLDFDNQYSLNVHETNEFIEETFLTGDVVETTTKGLESTQNLLSRLDFTAPLKDSFNLEFGVKYMSSFQNADLTMTNAVNGVDADSGFVSQFSYDQSILAGYFIGQKTWSKWSVKIGLRAEQTLIDAAIPNDTYQFSSSYLQLFPSAFVTRKFGKNSTLYFNAGRRINRPKMYMVNPFRYYSDRFLVEEGRPELRPEIVYASQIGVSRYSGKFGIDAHFFFKHIEDRNRRYLRQEEELSIISYKNVARSQVYGLVLSGRYMPAKWLTIRFNIDTWGTRIRDEEVTNNELMNTFGNATNLDFYFTVKKDWRFQFRNHFRPRYQLQQGYMQARYSMSLGASKSFFKKSLNVRVNVSDVLNTLRSYFRTNETANAAMDFYFLGNWEWETRVVYVTASYTFNSGIKGKKKRTSRNDDNNESTPGGF